MRDARTSPAGDNDRSPEPEPWWVSHTPIGRLEEPKEQDLPWWVPEPDPAFRWRGGTVMLVAGLALALLGGLVAASLLPRRPAEERSVADIAMVTPSDDEANVADEVDLPDEAEAWVNRALASLPDSIRVPSEGGELPRIQPGLTIPPPRPAHPEAMERAAAKAAPVPERVGPPAPATEVSLLRELTAVEEVGLGLSGPLVLRAYVTAFQNENAVSKSVAVTNILPLITTRSDLTALPLNGGPDTRLSLAAARELQNLSRKLRLHLASLSPPAPDGRRTNPDRVRDALLTEQRGKRPEWLRAAAVPALVQLLMHEEPPLRMALVELLAQIPEQVATAALAQRAAFDFDRDVRTAAVTALRSRKPLHYRPILLRALRYPWQPPAEHAADALAELGDRKAVPGLVRLLEEDDPAGPQVIRNRRVVVQEVVGINHVQNCLLCHPPAVKATEPCIGVDPVSRHTALRGPIQAGVGAFAPGGHNYSSLGPLNQPLLLRGDITFLRQDFSAQLPLGRIDLPGGAAPPTQRFDFVVRTRLARPKEVAAWKERPAGIDYPQRDATLRALRRITGKDAGSRTADWKALYPRAEAEVQAERIARKILGASPVEREAMLRIHRDTDGESHLLALALAAAELTGSARDRVRDTLGERLGRLPPEQLAPLLADPDEEVSRAARASEDSRRGKVTP